MSFVMPPFWARRPRPGIAAHMISVLVQPAVAIVSSSVASPSVVTCATAHGFVSGDTVTIASHTGSTPSITGDRIVTVLTSTTFSVPVAVTVGGTGGTATRSVPAEPLTLAEGQLRAGLDWPIGDPRDALMTSFIVAARAQVEHQTGLALLTQTRDISLDWLGGEIVTLPAQSRPLQSVTWVKSTDTSDVVQTLGTDQYVVDLGSGRLGLTLSGSWPTDLRPFQPVTIRIVAGWTAVHLIPSPLVQAVGLLTAHYATAGRDLVTSDALADVPHGYLSAIEPYQHVTLA